MCGENPQTPAEYVASLMESPWRGDDTFTGTVTVVDEDDESPISAELRFLNDKIEYIRVF